MRLNLYLRGIDLIDVEFHLTGRGVSFAMTAFTPREDGDDEEIPELSGGSAGQFERAEGPVWEEDQSAVVHGFGFGRRDGGTA